MIDGHFDRLTYAKLIIHHSFKCEFFHFIIFSSGGESVAEAQGGGHHHGLFVLFLFGFLAILLLASDDDVVMFLGIKVGEICREQSSFCVGGASEWCVCGFFIGDNFGLSGDVILEVGPYRLLIVKLIYNLPSLFYSFDDELDLVVEVVDLLYLYLQHVVLKYLLAAFGIVADILLQLHQLQMRLYKPFNPNGVIFEVCKFKLQFFIFLAKEDHLLSQRDILFHLIIDADMQFFVLPAVDAVVLDQHEHVPPSMLLILLQLLIFGLESLEFVYVLALHSNGVVLELIPDLSVCVFQGVPVCVQSADQVLKNHLQQQTLFQAFLLCQLHEFLKAGDDDMLLPLAKLPGGEILNLQQFRNGPGEPIQHIRVFRSFMRRMQSSMTLWYFEQ